MGQYKENFSSSGYVSLDAILYISVRYRGLVSHRSSLLNETLQRSRLSVKDALHPIRVSFEIKEWNLHRT